MKNSRTRFAAFGAEIGQRNYVGRTDEFRCEPAPGPIINFARRAVFDQPSGIHHTDNVRYRQRLGLIVGHVNCREPDPLLYGAQFNAHLFAQLGVQIGQRLVQEKHFGLGDQRAR